MNKGTSPGSDGLPVEFYIKLFPLIGAEFVNIVNQASARGALSPTQRHSIITLLAKYGADRELLCNWRPISLLNTDYKIISKSILIRMAKVAGDIISPTRLVVWPVGT
jgi:hypothetical protein